MRKGEAQQEGAAVLAAVGCSIRLGAYTLIHQSHKSLLSSWIVWVGKDFPDLSVENFMGNYFNAIGKALLKKQSYPEKGLCKLSGKWALRDDELFNNSQCFLWVVLRKDTKGFGYISTPE